jgi:hypothetical protein
MNSPVARIRRRYREFMDAPLDERQYTAYASWPSMIADIRWFLDMVSLIDEETLISVEKWLDAHPPSNSKWLDASQIRQIGELLAYVRRFRQKEVNENGTPDQRDKPVES